MPTMRRATRHVAGKAASLAAKSAARAAVAVADAAAHAHDAAPGVSVARKADLGDVAAIAALVNGFAAEDIMLPRTPAEVLASLDDYVVVRDVRGRLLACGALREYSPSLVELVSLAVVRAAHGRGLGSVIVAAVERLARKRGFTGLFAHTLSPAFFEGNGYVVVERARFPEKQARTTTSCLWKDLAPVERAIAIAA